MPKKKSDKRQREAACRLSSPTPWSRRGLVVSLGPRVARVLRGKDRKDSARGPRTGVFQGRSLRSFFGMTVGCACGRGEVQKDTSRREKQQSDPGLRAGEPAPVPAPPLPPAFALEGAQLICLSGRNKQAGRRGRALRLTLS